MSAVMMTTTIQASSSPASPCSPASTSRSARPTVDLTLRQIRGNVAQRYYNPTGKPSFNGVKRKKDMSIAELLAVGREIADSTIPIQCIEGFLLAMYHAHRMCLLYTPTCRPITLATNAMDGHSVIIPLGGEPAVSSSSSSSLLFTGNGNTPAQNCITALFPLKFVAKDSTRIHSHIVMGCLVLFCSPNGVVDYCCSPSSPASSGSPDNSPTRRAKSAAIQRSSSSSCSGGVVVDASSSSAANAPAAAMRLPPRLASSIGISREPALGSREARSSLRDLCMDFIDAYARCGNEVLEVIVGGPIPLPHTADKHTAAVRKVTWVLASATRCYCDDKTWNLSKAGTGSKSGNAAGGSATASRAATASKQRGTNNKNKNSSSADVDLDNEDDVQIASPRSVKIDPVEPAIFDNSLWLMEEVLVRATIRTHQHLIGMLSPAQMRVTGYAAPTPTMAMAEREMLSNSSITDSSSDDAVVVITNGNTAAGAAAAVDSHAAAVAKAKARVAASPMRSRPSTPTKQVQRRERSATPTRSKTTTTTSNSQQQQQQPTPPTTPQKQVQQQKQKSGIPRTPSRPATPLARQDTSSNSNSKPSKSTTAASTAVTTPPQRSNTRPMSSAPAASSSPSNNSNNQRTTTTTASLARSASSSSNYGTISSNAKMTTAAKNKIFVPSLDVERSPSFARTNSSSATAAAAASSSPQLQQQQKRPSTSMPRRSPSMPPPRNTTASATATTVVVDARYPPIASPTSAIRHHLQNLDIISANNSPSPSQNVGVRVGTATTSVVTRHTSSSPPTAATVQNTVSTARQIVDTISLSNGSTMIFCRSASLGVGLNDNSGGPSISRGRSTSNERPTKQKEPSPPRHFSPLSREDSDFAGVDDCDFFAFESRQTLAPKCAKATAVNSHNTGLVRQAAKPPSVVFGNKEFFGYEDL